MNKEPTLDKKTLCVLEAATRVFLQHGFSAASTDMIQKEAGVSKATIYNRYPTKEALFTAVIEERCKLTTTEVTGIQATSDNVEDILMQIGKTYLKIILSTEGIALYRTVAAEAVRFPEMGEIFYISGPHSINETIGGYLAEAEQKGDLSFHPMGVDQATVLFVSMLRGEGQMQGLMYPNSAPSDAQINHWTKLAVDTFLRAFKA